MLKRTCLAALAAGLFAGCQGPATTRLPPERTAGGAVMHPQRGDPAAQEVMTDPPIERTEPIPARAPEQHVPPIPPREPAQPDDPHLQPGARPPESAPGVVVPAPQPGPTVTEPVPGTLPGILPGDEPPPQEEPVRGRTEPEPVEQ